MTTAAADLSWLSEHCKKADRLTTESMAWLKAPFSVSTTGGGSWACASDGATVIAVHVEKSGLPAPYGAVHLDVIEWLEKPAGKRTLQRTRETLLEWCGFERECEACHGTRATTPCAPCEATGRVDCAECDGNGKIDCECKCGDQHETECEKCRDGKVDCVPCAGSGRAPCVCLAAREAVDKGALGEVVLDRTKLRRLLVRFPSGTLKLTFGGEFNQIHIQGSTMRAILMPIAGACERVERLAGS